MGVSNRQVPRLDWVVVAVWLVVALVVHVVGEMRGFYVEFGWFQVVTHALSASAITAAFVMIGRHRNMSRSRLVRFVVVMVAAAGIVWELAEFSGVLSALLSPLYVATLRDAVLDVSANFLGTTITLLVFLTVTDDGDE